MLFIKRIEESTAEIHFPTVRRDTHARSTVVSLEAQRLAMAVDGRLVRVCDENPNLVAFISLNADQKVCTNALVFVAGLTDGFMSLPYTESLSRALLAVDYSLVCQAPGHSLDFEASRVIARRFKNT